MLRLVLGLPRSGTTLAAMLLGCCRDVAAFSESRVFDYAARFVEDRLNQDERFVELMKNVGLKPIDYARPFLLAGIEVLSLAARARGKAHFVEKSCYLHQYLSMIDATLEGQVRYLFVVRHPLDVASSMLAHPQTVPKFYLQGDAVEGIARFIEQQSTEMFAFRESARDPGTVKLIRYEDLVHSPRVVLLSMAEFLLLTLPDGDLETTWSAANIDYMSGDPGLLHGRRAIDNESIGRWRHEGVARRDTLRRALAGTCQRLGYEA